MNPTRSFLWDSHRDGEGSEPTISPRRSKESLCISTLRLRPSPQVVPPEDAVVCGQDIPGGTSVGLAALIAEL